MYHSKEYVNQAVRLHRGPIGLLAITSVCSWRSLDTDQRPGTFDDTHRKQLAGNAGDQADEVSVLRVQGGAGPSSCLASSALLDQ